MSNMWEPKNIYIVNYNNLLVLSTFGQPVARQLMVN